MRREEKISIKDIISSVLVIGILGSVLVGGVVAKANYDNNRDQNAISQESIMDMYPTEYVIIGGSDGVSMEEITMGDYSNEAE